MISDSDDDNDDNDDWLIITNPSTLAIITRADLNKSCHIFRETMLHYTNSASSHGLMINTVIVTGLDSFGSAETCRSDCCHGQLGVSPTTSGSQV